ncbi:putative repeat protein (TIGR01451 family) [Deinococcus metalli]|uniref:Putative repeat protein (TIGR01451 family) n=1 Tax=Deinococcus metalli TaxID=1141878 RepID=A0A7W8KJC7_9DEIO|nr:hypothetical protein [Deinococcus metalli]MBB5377624.1 putative repeat protein (TIGR01451 family) [Deinococcus metalli]GHF52131.1 hypothetical protein GCM10017781_30510 [Deinococcus metalli]
MKPLTPFLLAILGVGTALAQAATPVVLNLALFAVHTVKADGKTTEQLVPSPGNVLPGDVLSQIVTVKNTGSKAVLNFPVTLPVPKNTVYLAPESGLASLRTEYSVDGGKTFAPAPLMKTVTVTENGKSVSKQVEVKPSEYTAVRWYVTELAAQSALKLGYRIQVK